MALPTGLNDLAKLTLLASDASYFTNNHPVLSGSALAALLDTSYGVSPTYTVPSGFFEIRQVIDTATGFGFIAYRNQQTNEVIIAQNMGSRLVIIHCEDPPCAAEPRARLRGCATHVLNG